MATRITQGAVYSPYTLYSVDRETPVGFQKMRCSVDIKAVDGSPAKLLQKLLAAAERSCVNPRTLRSGISIETVIQEE